MASDPDRSEAVILFLGYGITPYPNRDPLRLNDCFGVDDGFDLIQYAKSVLEELYAVDPDWTRGDLTSETSRAVRRVGENHPELSDEALAALGWSFRWDWK